MSLLDETIKKISSTDNQWKQKARTYLGQLTMPYWALGDLLDLSVQLVAIKGALKFRLPRKGIFVLAADHGITEEGVSQYPAEVTKQMVLNFLADGAGVNAIAQANGVSVTVVDMGVNHNFTSQYSPKFLNKKVGFGTKNFCKEQAMSTDEAIKSIEHGINIINRHTDTLDVFAAGEMGIGNTSSSAAILSVLSGCSLEDATGSGTGINEEQRQNKINTLKKALDLHKNNLATPLDILASLGGFEIGAVTGMILGAAAASKPFVLDGFICSAGAMLAKELCPASMDYIIAAHQSAEKGHHLMLRHLNKKPLVQMNLRLGEGSGAALVMPFLDSACALLNDVSTFEEAAVSKEKKS